jgi:hypothetical protein
MLLWGWNMSHLLKTEALYLDATAENCLKFPILMTWDSLLFYQYATLPDFPIF